MRVLDLMTMMGTKEVTMRTIIQVSIDDTIYDLRGDYCEVINNECGSLITLYEVQ